MHRLLVSMGIKVRIIYRLAKVHAKQSLVVGTRDDTNHKQDINYVAQACWNIDHSFLHVGNKAFPEVARCNTNCSDGRSSS